MKYAIASILLLNLTACAQVPQWVADSFDRSDACQTKSRAPNTPAPDWCGAANGKTVFVQPGIARNNYIITVK